jgi:hypothetical protein
MSKNAKAKSKAKSNKAKSNKVTAGKAAGGAAATTTEDASATPATAEAVASRGDRDVGMLIEKLDVASLHDDDITTILLHCAAALSVRKVIGRRGVVMTESAGNTCYTKAGDSSTVSLWSGGFKVGETSEADAKASGIPPCGG